MARIGIDATAVGTGAKGVARYQKNMVASLSEIDCPHEYFVFHRHLDRPVFNVSKSNWHFIPVSFCTSSIWDQIQLPWLAKRFQLDLIHTAYDRLPLFSRIPFLIYLFEIPTYRIHLSRAQKLRERWYQRFAESYNAAVFPYCLRRSALIAVSSEFTKRDLMEKFHVAEYKIRVVYAAHETEFKPVQDSSVLSEFRHQLTGGTDYLLHFSTGDPRENTLVVLDAFKIARKRLGKDLKLVIAGINPKWKSTQLQFGRNGTLRDSIVWRKFATDQDLVRLYQGASAYVDPSLYEGFGFQPLEAMACGTPVIGSNVTAVPEIVGEAGILVQPNDPEELAQAIVRLMEDPELQSKLREKGIQRSNRFSWLKAAKSIFASLEEILNSAQ